MSSCSVHNRLTSPKILDKEEYIVPLGSSIDPLALTEYGAIQEPIAVFQPIFGYRAGIAKQQELGITLYGILAPAFVVDYEHNFFETNKFMLSGDLAVFGGLLRPTGGQYDLIFGNQKFYGTVGIGNDFFKWVGEEPYYLFGIGFERMNDTPFGLQVSFARTFISSFNYSENFLSIGFKYDFLRTKKKYR